MERRIAKGNACCRGCDVDLRKGKDELIYTYSHRNRGQNILFCLECAKKIGKLAGSEMDDTEMKWRDLALQFDGHRMQAISLLRMILSELPENDYMSARDFIKSGPLPGEEVLRNRLTSMISSELKLPPEYKVTEDMDIGAKHGLESGYRKAIEDVKLLNGIKS